MEDDPNRLYQLDGVAHIAGAIHLEVSKKTYNSCFTSCTWFQETFSELPQGADDEMVRKYARAYIMMLLSTRRPKSSISARWSRAYCWRHPPRVVLPPRNCIDKFTLKCTWFQEIFSELPKGADEMVRRYARAYIMILLCTRLFGDNSSTHLHIRWLPYARLEDMGQYSWGLAALSWLFRCMCHVANRNIVKLASPLQLH
ncbi:hypothetical protein Ahy_A10g047527 [Arachis hypogaea]|uniref:Aminotransferase-like plant mobile domain-containing protein n=1 Tax=Arachis hypogaea TaxID=3818 RepID=A0A445B2X2_ARAHY|nr:hypothetical protein Ahy_A10g047527 [Arachis hypogaea]